MVYLFEYPYLQWFIVFYLSESNCYTALSDVLHCFELLQIKAIKQNENFVTVSNCNGLYFSAEYKLVTSTTQ